jgi:F-type H+-transporting ATPase subunit b
MRTSLLRSLILLAASPVALLAQAPEGTRQFMKPDTGLMIWTLIIFVILMFVLSRFAFGPLTKAVRSREETLQAALDSAKRDRDEAAKVLAESQAKLEAARGEAQMVIADGRAVGEKLRTEMLEQTRKEQADVLDRARKEIENEKTKAIGELRREAVDLALAGASKVIEQNLESPKNRHLVETYLASLGTLKVS